jgi:methionyl-tRNA formyltransferase
MARDPVLRILVCTKADLPSLIAMNRLLPALEGHEVEVLLTERVRPAERCSPELGLIKFLERDLPLTILLPLLEQGGTRPARLRTFGELAQDLAVPVTTIRRINDGDGFARARAFRPDLVVSSRFSLVFRAPMLTLPRHGILNLHPGPLPGYGGLFAIFRQMLAGRREIGVTLHQVDAGIDTGPVIMIRPLPIRPDRSMLWHVLRAYEAGVPAILDAVARLDAGMPLALRPQDPDLMRYFHLPENAEFAAFAEAGFKLYDLNEYAGDLRYFLGLSHEACDGVAAMALLPQPSAAG